MRKFIAMLLAMMMVLAFTACGGSSEEAETESAEAPVVHAVSGIVEDMADGNLDMYSEANQELSFNIENAEINSENGIKEGDTAVVEYEGEISSGDTSGCKVLTVTEVASEPTIIEGKVESIDKDNTVTISSNDKKYTFNTKGIDPKNGPLKVGKKVKIKYAGIIDDVDTSHAYVRAVEITDKTEATEKPTEKTEDSITVKAVSETVWASTEVNVRTEPNVSSDKVATVKKGQKLTRTGILSNGWSRVKYKDKDRYIASNYLTKKDPAKKETKETKKETKATETKATETKATETKATESKEPVTEETESKEPVTEETESQEPVTEETESQEPVTEEPETDPPEPATVTVKGVVTECGGRSITLDNGVTYNIAGAELDITEDEAIGQTVVIEYKDGTTDAIHVYPVDGAKGADEGSGHGLITIVILGLIAAVIAAIAVVARNRRRPEA